MSTRVISFYHDFECLAGQCPAGCCYGWRIPIDAETLSHYEEIKGVLGRHIRLFVNKRSDPPVFRKILGRCPFLDSDRLCAFQRAGMEEEMPLVCRIYPRDVVRCIDTVEVTMELSCPAVARLLLSNPKRLSFIPYEQEIGVLSDIDNDDSTQSETK